MICVSGFQLSQDRSLCAGIIMSPLSSDVSQQKIRKKLLCLVIGYSFFKGFNPLLSYLVQYMVQVKGLTNFQVTNKVFPVASYASLPFLLLVAPVCEYVSYKTIIIVGSFCTLLDKLLLCFGATVLSFQIMEIFAGFSSGASYFVYQAYLFCLVTENHFQTMTGVSQASASAAIFISSELGQILVLIGVSYNNILYITIASAVVNCIVVFLLPKEEGRQQRQHFMLNFFSRDQGFWSIIKETWTDKRLQLLSFWWAFGLAGFELSLNYGTVLFEAIDSSSTYNGQVIALGTALAVVVALSSVYLKRPVAKLGGFIYIFGSLAYGAFCLKLAYTRALWVAYVIYIIMLGIEKLMICFVYAQCGSLIKNDRYALVFSFNSGLGQAIMAILQAIIEAAKMDIVAQYKVLGSFFLVFAVVFSIPYGVYVWKTQKVQIISLDDSGASKIDPVKEPLMENESVVRNGT